MTDARRRPVWDYPDCPNCESEIFVGKSSTQAAYVCYLCGEMFGAMMATAGP